MPPLLPVLLGDRGAAILRRRWSYGWMTELVTRSAEKRRREAEERGDASTSTQIQQIVSNLPERLPKEGPLSEISESKAQELKESSRILRETMESIERVAGREASPDDIREMVKAQESDDRNLNRVIKRTKQKPPTTLPLLISKMGSRDTISITKNFKRYNDLMWYLSTMNSNANETADFEPELWVRDDNGHPWGCHRSWVYVEGTERIDYSRAVIEVVNAFGRKDYIVIAVNEGREEIPMPINVPRLSREGCCDRNCGTFKRHLENLWDFSRQVEWAGHIGKKKKVKSILDNRFDTGHFPPRRNDIYIQCLPCS